MTQLVDRFDRRFPYLRLSVTDVCNFRCTYCLPNGYQKTGCQNFLSLDEIKRTVEAFVHLGVKKVRITGGEPMVRGDIVEIVRTIKSVPGIETVALTTNGYRLAAALDSLLEAGLNHLNISIDSLSEAGFQKITGTKMFKQVLESIDAAKAALANGQLKALKLNTVLLRGLNDQEFPDFLNYVEGEDISLRFIELMETGQSAEYFRAHHMSPAGLIEDLRIAGWNAEMRGLTDGPARMFTHPDYAGSLGFIAPYSKNFCDSCNRLRVSSKGGLKLCLFGDGDHDLRPYLQHDHQQEMLVARIVKLLGLKPATHYLAEGDTGATPHLASIGG